MWTVSPEVRLAQQVYVELSFNASFSSSRLHYAYYLEPFVSLVPSRVAVEGNTSVEVHGAGFSRQAWQYGLLRCAFEDADERVTMPAMFISTELVYCRTLHP